MVQGVHSCEGKEEGGESAGVSELGDLGGEGVVSLVLLGLCARRGLLAGWKLHGSEGCCSWKSRPRQGSCH